MSGPQSHVYLDDRFLLYDRGRLFFRDGSSAKLDRFGRGIVECLERGESERRLLCWKLHELEVGGDLELVRAGVTEALAPPSVLIEAPPLDLAAPAVIVCSVAAGSTGVDVRALVRRLRRTCRVVHISHEDHTTGRSPDDVCSAVQRPALATPFRFLQWARSFVRFHSRAVLVTCGREDSVIFGDLAARNYSAVIVGADWPPPTRIETLLGADALRQDPLASLRQLFYALGAARHDELDRIRPTAGSDFAALSSYAVRNASRVLYARADHPAELERIGRDAASNRPLHLHRPARRRTSNGPRYLAFVADGDHLDRLGRMVATVMLALGDTGALQCLVRTHQTWADLTLSEGRVVMTPRPSAPPSDGVALALVFPGLVRHLEPTLTLLGRGVPCLFYPTAEPHPLFDELQPVQVATPTSHELPLQVAASLDDGSPTRRSLQRAGLRLSREWDAAHMVRRLVDVAAEADRTTP